MYHRVSIPGQKAQLEFIHKKQFPFLKSYRILSTFYGLKSAVWAFIRQKRYFNAPLIPLVEKNVRDKGQWLWQVSKISLSGYALLIFKERSTGLPNALHQMTILNLFRVNLGLFASCSTSSASSESLLVQMQAAHEFT